VVQARVQGGGGSRWMTLHACGSSGRQRDSSAARAMPRRRSERSSPAGVTKPVLYYHFESKGGCTSRSCRTPSQTGPAVEASLRDDGTDAADRVRGLCGAIVDCALANLDVVRLIRSLHHSAPQEAPSSTPGSSRSRSDRAHAHRRGGVRRGSSPGCPWGHRLARPRLVNVCVDSNLASRDRADASGFRSALDRVLASAAPGKKPGRSTFATPTRPDDTVTPSRRAPRPKRHTPRRPLTP